MTPSSTSPPPRVARAGPPESPVHAWPSALPLPKTEKVWAVTSSITFSARRLVPKLVSPRLG